MDQSSFDHKKLFWVMIIWGLLVGGAVSGGIYIAVNWVLANFPSGMDENLFLEKAGSLIEQARNLSQSLYTIVIPAVIAGGLVLFVLMGLILKAALGKGSEIDEEKEQGSGRVKKDFIDRKLEQERKIRLFLHPLSVLQREGRLLDFFQEDLSLYEDDQIGAAVRSIQEDCKKTIKKYINLKPVVGEEEEQEIVIEDGFDMDSIKLTGNVAGKPPFKGIVKHRGWKAGKKELPKLSNIKDVCLISPAEVEIQ